MSKLIFAVAVLLVGLVAFNVANIRFDRAYEKAAEAKQIEEQKAEQKWYELIQAHRQAEVVAAKTKGKGDAAREEARGVADVSASLSGVLIQQQYLARWDGRLPQFVQLPGDGAPRR